MKRGFDILTVIRRNDNGNVISTISAWEETLDEAIQHAQRMQQSAIAGRRTSSGNMEILSEYHARTSYCTIKTAVFGQIAGESVA